MRKKNRLKNQAGSGNPLKGQADAAIQAAPKYFCLNFKNFDASQGQTFGDWEKAGLLSLALERWREHCKQSLQQCKGSKFKVYGSFPPNTAFKHPKHVPPDAQWASMHIQGKECVAGHVIGDVFYVVFLDSEHQFWITEKKHT